MAFAAMPPPDTRYNLKPLKPDVVCGVGPSAFDRRATVELEAFISEFANPGPPRRQLAAIKTLQDIFKGWCNGAAFHMFISGSYKMNVHTKEADIDVVFVTTAAVTRAAVFDGFCRALEMSEAVTAVTAIPNSRVPLVCATVDGQEFDVMTCHLRGQVLPSRDAMLDSYVWMNGLDEASILAFNGPRITTVVLAAVPKPRHFLTAVRFLRLWAKQRAIYSNKSGYLGGINIVLLVAYVALRNPCAVASTLVLKTVQLVAKWDWSNREPLVAFLDDGTASASEADATITASDAEPGTEKLASTCPVWLRTYDLKGGEKDAVTVLTPCYPRFNTMHAASDYSVKALAAEFARAHNLLSSMHALATMDYATVAAALPIGSMCRRFLKVSVSVPSNRRGMAWQGFLESQTRFLLKYLAQEELAIASFRFIPIWLSSKTDTHCVREAYVTADDDGKIRTYAVKGDIHRAFAYFMQTHACAGPPQPKAAGLALAFVSAADVPVASLVAEMLTFDTVAPVTYGLPPPLPASVASGSTLARLSGPPGTEGLPIRVLGAIKPRPGTQAAANSKRLRVVTLVPCLAAFTSTSTSTTASASVPAAPLQHKPRQPRANDKKNVARVLADGTSPAGTIVRPRRVDGVDVTPAFHVYIGKEWKMGGWAFEASQTLLGAPPAAEYVDRCQWLAAYNVFAGLKMKTDRAFNALVRSLAGKTLACWCTAAEHCHGSILLRLAASQKEAEVLIRRPFSSSRPVAAKTKKRARLSCVT